MKSTVSTTGGPTAWWAPFAADGAVLEGVLSSAVADVEYLWPGRDPEDGAMALLSTSLHASSRRAICHSDGERCLATRSPGR